MSYYSEPVAHIFRADAIESIHYGSAVVVDSNGHLLYRIGDPYMVTYFRSSSKPFQAIPVIESGAAKRFNFTPKEIAIMAGSHSGEDFHIETVKQILDKIGLTPDHLQCGVHVPHRYTALNLVPEPGREFTQLEHNCSGKHAGMLAAAVHKGLTVEDYLSPEHLIQQMIKKALSDLCVYPEEKITVGIDGCSAPNFAMPIYNMALGFARFISPNSVAKDKAKVYSAISQAMMEYPEMVAGTQRFDTVAARTPGESMISKAGAEAIESFGFVGRKAGATLKITDGGTRALFPVATELLYKLGARSKCDELEKFHRPPITNFRNIEVGRIEPVFSLHKIEEE